MRLSASRYPALLFALLCACPLVAGAAPAATITIAQFGSELGTLQQLAGQCETSAAACDGKQVPETQRVAGASGGEFQVSWSWLGDALITARTANSGDRVRGMDLAQAHLADLASSIAADRSETPGNFQAARHAADAALRRSEFRAAERPGWLERQIAKGQDWFLRMLLGVGRLGRKAPWIAPAVEGTCFALAAAGLLWFVRRSLSRQSLQIALAGGAVPSRNPGEQGSAGWSRQAEALAAAGQWREAVHAVYWAAVSTLEERRAWRANATRTPREYLRLLRSGSEVHGVLRDLTRRLERVWYGGLEAQEGEYQAAWGDLRALQRVGLESSRLSAPHADGPGKTGDGPLAGTAHATTGTTA